MRRLLKSSGLVQVRAAFGFDQARPPKRNRAYSAEKFALSVHVHMNVMIGSAVPGPVEFAITVSPLSALQEQLLDTHLGTA